jgi:hypothetical protein
MNFFASVLYCIPHRVIMKLRYPVFLFLILLFSVPQKASAQLKIVKDNIACLYGLKNDKGEWVVSAKFQEITDIGSGFYRTKVAENYGVLTNTGKEIIPPAYDFIQQPGYTPNYVYTDGAAGFVFIVRKDGNTFGAFLGNGKEVFAVKYASIVVDLRFGYIVQTTSGISNLISAAGDTLIRNVKGTIMPFSVNDITVFGSSYNPSTFYVTGNAGAIDRTGKIIVPPVYDHAQLCRKEEGKPVIAVRTRGRVGFYSADGTELLAPKYIFVDNGYSNGSIPCRQQHHEMQLVMEEKHYGLLASDYKLAAPCVYDELINENYDFHMPAYHWRARKNNKWGTLDENGKEVLAPVYDTIIRLADLKEVYGQGRKLLSLSFLVKQNGKWGLLDERGNVLLPIVHSKFIINPNQRTLQRKLLAFQQGEALQLYDYAERKTVGTFTPQSRIAGKVLIYQPFPDELLVMEAGASHAVESMASPYGDGVGLTRNGNYYTLQVGTKTYLLRRNGTIWMGPKHIKAMSQFGSYPMIITHSGRMGLLGTSDKKLLVDTIYESFSGPLSEDPNLFWVKPAKMKCRNAPTQNDCWCGWAVADTNGRLVTPPDFAEPVSDLFSNKVIIVATNKGSGIYSAGRKKYLLPPLYKGVKKIHDNMYQVTTWGNRFGITDSSGTWLTDTTWKKLYIISNTWKLVNREVRAPKAAELGWLLLDGTQQAIINADGKLITDTAEVRAYRRRAIATAVLNPRHINYISPVLDSMQSKPACDGEQLQRITAHIADQLITGIDMQYGIDEQQPASRTCLCFKETPDYQNRIYAQYGTASPEYFKTDERQTQYKLLYAGTHAYSLLAFTPPGIQLDDKFYRNESSSTVYTYTNYRYKNGKFESLALSDLIRGDYKSILQEELVTALKKRDDLNLDCHATDKLFTLTEERFSISDAGLVLYLPGGAGMYGQLVGLTIPWANLLPHAKKESLVQEMGK